MPTDLEYRARERQRKGESRRQASEAQREKGRQRSLRTCSVQNISNTQDFVSAPLENVNCKECVLTLIAGFR